MYLLKDCSLYVSFDAKIVWNWHLLTTIIHPFMCTVVLETLTCCQRYLLLILKKLKCYSCKCKKYVEIGLIEQGLWELDQSVKVFLFYLYEYSKTYQEEEVNGRIRSYEKKIGSLMTEVGSLKSEVCQSLSPQSWLILILPILHFRQFPTHPIKSQYGLTHFNTCMCMQWIEIDLPMVS